METAPAWLSEGNINMVFKKVFDIEDNIRDKEVEL
jgi:hypothetical protein